MKKLLLLLCIQFLGQEILHSQTFTVGDLVRFTSLSSKNAERFLSKNKFIVPGTVAFSSENPIIFHQKIKGARKEFEPQRTIEVYKQDEITSYTLQTTSKGEFLSGQDELIKNGFLYDLAKNYTNESSMFYQKRNMTIKTSTHVEDSIPQYSFELEVRDLPDLSNVRYAEDLLQFTSHEFLVSFFGENNVKRDLYYFSEKELKKCSVLFFGSNRQVVFVWQDERNMQNVEYLLVSTKIPTEATSKSEKELSTNEWKLRNGIQHGTNIKDLLRINENDFTVYGNPSELAFMIQPTNNGNIDFTKTALLLACKGCKTDIIFDKPLVSALDIARKDLPVSVFDMIIYPDNNAKKNAAGVVRK